LINIVLQQGPKIIPTDNIISAKSALVKISLEIPNFRSKLGGFKHKFLQWDIPRVFGTG
jgi:hypothetical protein